MTQAWVQIRDHPVCDRCLGLDIGGVVRVPQEEIRLAGPEQAEIVCFCRGWEGECERVQRAGQGMGLFGQLGPANHQLRLRRCWAPDPGWVAPP